MTTWILFGVAGIVVVAVIVRMLSGGSGKRHAPTVLEEHDRPDVDISIDDRLADADGPMLLSEEGGLDTTDHPENRITEHLATVASTENGDVSEGSSSGFQGTNRIDSLQHSIFSDFRGIVSSSKDGLSIPDPEDLPLDKNELTFGSVTPVLAQLLPESSRRKEKQRQDLSAAGYHSRGSWLNLNAVRFVFAFLALALAGLGLIAAPPAAEPYLLAAVIAAPLVGWALPPLLVSSKANERRTDIERALPDALDMLNMGVSQGLTIQSSLRRIGPEFAPAHPELAEELQIVSQQAKVGSLNQALHSFAKRMDSTEVNSFTSLLIQSETTGTSVSKALADYSDSMRSSIRERADSRANAASFKLLFPTVLCLMPSVFLFLMGPAVVSMSDFFGNTANELLQDRENAINTLDQGPRIVQPVQ